MYNNYLYHIINTKADATATISGSISYPNIRAKVKFYKVKEGVLVCTEAIGLPYNNDNPFSILAYHIHKGTSCSGNDADPFSDALGHYNPHNMEHPYHAGDLPPLFANYGYAFSIVLTARFTIDEIIGRAMIIHRNVDDFTTDPSGNAGEKIACGIVLKSSR